MKNESNTTVRAFRAAACISLEGEKSACASALFSPLRVIYDCLMVTVGGRIVCLEPYTANAVPVGATLVDLGDVIITPPVINAHTHIQLSHMAQKTCRGQGFVPWLRSLIALLSLPLDEGAIQNAVQNMYEAGTGHFADFTHIGLEMVARAAEHRGLSATFLAEWFGFADTFAAVNSMPPRCQSAQMTLNTYQRAHLIPCAHALYSTAPCTIQGIQQWCATQKKPFVIHLAESYDELEALTEGKGDLVELYSPMVLPHNWQAPHCSPIKYAHRLHILESNTLAIHCVHSTQEERNILADKGVSICLCPRSNNFIGVGMAPIRDYVRLPINLCLGTDGLSSNDDVNVWLEAQFLYEHHALPWTALLRMLTVNAAAALALGYGEKHTGSLCVGARAQWSLFPFDRAMLIDDGILQI